MAWSPFKTQNTRQQDIFLLAKMHYKKNPAVKLATTALQVCAAHAGMNPLCLTYKDAASIITHEYVETGLILKTPRDVARVLLAVGPDPYFPTILGGDHQQEGGYFAALIDALMGDIAMMPVFSDVVNEVWMLPFERPTVDPKLQELIYVPEPEPAVGPFNIPLKDENHA